MNAPEKVKLTAPCGLDCFNCDVFEANLTPDRRSALAARLGRRPDEVGCDGCRALQGVNPFAGACPTYECASERDVDYCFECDIFPCRRLAPARDGAEKNSHNMKLYNLCRMKAVGVERWADHEASAIRLRYYTGRFRPGRGARLSDEEED